MTQIEELMKRARDEAKNLSPSGEYHVAQQLCQLANALEAQAARVKELQDHIRDISRESNEQVLRITSLEAQLKAFRETLEKWQEWWSLPWQAKRPATAQLVYNHAARVLSLATEEETEAAYVKLTPALDENMMKNHSQDVRQLISAALDDAAAVGGDAQWNAACDEIAKNLRELFKPCRAHDGLKRAYNSGIDDALSLIDSMRRG